MKSLTDFALKEEYKCFKPVEDKLADINSLIDWKLLVTVKKMKHGDSCKDGCKAGVESTVKYKID